MNFNSHIKNNLYNIPGWRTSRKIIVIESDDWGSIRTQSTKDFEALKKLGVDKNHYNRLDSLENTADLELLYQCLSSVTDKSGHHPKITANFVMSNPDFDQIKESGFSRYHFENFVHSYLRYQGSEDTFSLVKEGLTKNLFFPQFHGREHLQVEYWMRDLRLGKKETVFGLNHNFFAFGKNDLDAQGYLSSFNATNKVELESVKDRIEEGLRLFETVFGYKSDSVIAPQNTMHKELLPFMKQLDVMIIQGARVNKQPRFEANEKQMQKRVMGRKNEYGQVDIVRNVTFEPASGKIDWVEKSMKEIATAFFWKKPAVICSHRVNFIGGLNETNRKNGLSQLKKLLTEVQKKWPDIEFMNTVELATAINNGE